MRTHHDVEVAGGERPWDASRRDLAAGTINLPYAGRIKAAGSDRRPAEALDRKAASRSSNPRRSMSRGGAQTPSKGDGRRAPTRVSTESGQASGLSHAANCNAGIADRKFALAVSGRRSDDRRESGVL